MCVLRRRPAPGTAGLEAVFVPHVSVIQSITSKDKRTNCSRERCRWNASPPSSVSSSAPQKLKRHFEALNESEGFKMEICESVSQQMCNNLQLGAFWSAPQTFPASSAVGSTPVDFNLQEFHTVATSLHLSFIKTKIRVLFKRGAASVLSNARSDPAFLEDYGNVSRSSSSH